MHWKYIALTVCAYGVIKKFRPATPFLTPYLLSPYKNFTDVQLYSQIYPLWCYSYLIALIPIFFLTDILRYRPIVMLEATSFCATSAILIWGTTLWQMQLMQICYGVSTASEIAYFSLMYVIVDQKHFKRITSYLRTATLVGKFLAYGLAQFLVSFHIGSYLLLNQISFGCSCITVFIAVLLSSASSYQTKEELANATKGQRVDAAANCSERAPMNAKQPAAQTVTEQGTKAYFRDIWTHFKIFKNNAIVLKWSIWWALAGCGTFQVQNYVQNLWAVLQKDGDAYNGITECANTLIGAIVCFLVQYVKVDWKRRGELVLSVNSTISAGLLVVMSQTNNLFLAYFLYVAFLAIYHMLITVASGNIASQINDNACYGLVFGWNTFSALLLQSVLTLIVADERGLALPIRTQFLVYGCYFGAVATLFMCSFASSIFRSCRS